MRSERNRSVGELKANLLAALEGVGGWLDSSEAWALHEVARNRPQRSPAVIVEVGSYHGRSTISLALGMKAGGGGTVFAVDPQANEPDQYELFCANIQRAGVDDVVQLLRSYSHEARASFKDGSVDVLFVDGPHNYGAVVKDIRDWRSSLRDGAVVAFNDAFWIEGVRRALQDEVALRPSPYRRPRWRYNTLFFDHLVSEAWTRKDDFDHIRLRTFLHVGGRWTAFHGRVNKSSTIPIPVKKLDRSLLLSTLGIVLPRTR